MTHSATVDSSLNLADLPGGPISATAWSYVKFPTRLFQSTLGVEAQPASSQPAVSNVTIWQPNISGRKEFFMPEGHDGSPARRTGLEPRLLVDPPVERKRRAMKNIIQQGGHLFRPGRNRLKGPIQLVERRVHRLWQVIHIGALGSLAQIHMNRCQSPERVLLGPNHCRQNAPLRFPTLQPRFNPGLDSRWQLSSGVGGDKDQVGMRRRLGRRLDDL